ncbi:Hypothetical predicted protein [Lynx pardinus]|uniref:Uncharacterized protein n=1 Tax=Lynx pardinus TaxID=191816 RepID=A0A485MV83_LYNPA|nr:Hypothetical predicted protein [Lynx pardinus]
MFTHQPTWDDCQQLLRILFTTEERERIQLEARKLVLEDDGQPTSNPDLINAAFPLTRPPQDEWDYNTAEAEGKDIKNKEEILALLAALWEPKKLAIVHCPGHQKATDPVSRGNNLADRTAKDIARPPAQLLTLQLPDPGPQELPPSPEYSESDIRGMSKLPVTRVKDGWWRDSKSSIILPDKLGWQVLERIHHSTHLGSRRMLDLLRQTGLKTRNVSNKVDQVVTKCTLCQLNNANSNPQATGRVHEDVWPKLKELYETGPPPIPHQFRPGDWVLVKRHRQENLEPRWKGPFQVILTPPTAIKVDRIATWIHCTHAKPVHPFSDLIGPPAKGTTWTINRSKDNPLKITLRRKPPKP